MQIIKVIIYVAWLSTSTGLASGCQVKGHTVSLDDGTVCNVPVNKTALL